MARSPAEIQAQIRLTRRAIDERLDALDGRVAYRAWGPYALLAGGALAGLALSRIPVLRVVRTVGTLAATVLLAVQVHDVLRGRLRRPPTDPHEAPPRTSPSPDSRPPGPAVDRAGRGRPPVRG